MHSNRTEISACVERFKAMSMHTVVTVEHSVVLSSEKFSLHQSHTTFKGGVSKTKSTETVRAR